MLGLRVPDDLSVIGFDDLPMARWAWPAADHHPPAADRDGGDRDPHRPRRRHTDAGRARHQPRRAPEHRRPRAMISPANPVVPGFFPDPSVCRADDGYYLACSSFEYFPGVPIHHSDDLQTWTHVANALDRPEQLPLAGAPASGGIYAPTLRHHDGLFWLVTTNVSSARTRHLHGRGPARALVGSVPVDGAAGIDPDLAWDADGTCWLTYSELGGGGSTRSAGRSSRSASTRSGRPLEPPRALWSGTGLQFPEAPHLYEIDGTWYLLIAEGGTDGPRGLDRPRPARRRGRSRAARQPDPQPPQHRPPGAEHRPRRPRPGARRLVVDGPARHPPRGRHPGGPCAGARDLPHAGALGRRLAGRRAGATGAPARGPPAARRLRGARARSRVDLRAHAPRRRAVADRTARLAGPPRP